MKGNSENDCYEDFSELPTRSNHPWTDENYMNSENAECKRCGRKMIEWFADIQAAIIIHKSRAI